MMEEQGPRGGVQTRRKSGNNQFFEVFVSIPKDKSEQK